MGEAVNSTLREDIEKTARARILGVSAINMPIAVDTIAQWIAARRHNYVCVTGVHGLMESHRDPELRAIHKFL
jgi:N-acetylglucosaminyldiphosphoundecaprenol N-acetyl-beta-D-mannosaminyltransferase